MQLQDLHFRSVECTLWDSYVDQFSTFVTNNVNAQFIIMLIQFAKVKKWNRKGAIGNAMFSTQVYINDYSILEIADFKKSLLANIANTSFTLDVSSISTQPEQSRPESFWKNCRRVTLDDIPKVTEVTDCVALATINSVCSNKPWYYISCQKCTYKVTHNDTNGAWICKSCGPNVSNVVPRLQVSEHNDNFPEELNDLCGHTILFVFLVSSFNLENESCVYTVKKIRVESVIDAFNKLPASNEDDFSTQVTPTDKTQFGETTISTSKAGTIPKNKNKKQDIKQKNVSNCCGKRLSSANQDTTLKAKHNLFKKNKNCDANDHQDTSSLSQNNNHGLLSVKPIRKPTSSATSPKQKQMYKGNNKRTHNK